MVAEMIQFEQLQSEKEKPKEEPLEKKTGVIRKPNSTKLYVELYPNGIREQISSRLEDTPENEKLLIAWVADQREKIANDTFVFAEAFPNASEKKKALHAQLEGTEHRAEVGSFVFNAYVDRWAENNLDGFTPIKKADYKGVINYWIKPYFNHMTFGDITGITLKSFVKTFKHKSGKKRGHKLSTSRAKKILTVLRAIWDDAVEEYQWDRSDPFTFIRKFLREDFKKRPKKADPEVFRFAEWMSLVDNMIPHYRPMIETMIMTGMSMSEAAGLKKSSIKDDHFLIENSIVRGYEKEELKTSYRRRKVPLTKKLREVLNVAIHQTSSEYVFRNARGNAVNHSFRDSAWPLALKKAGLEYKVPYTMRHTFAAWSLALDMHPNRLVKLMGHNSKKMIYEVYGDYVEGLETDTIQIREYFGYDFK
ncbi:MAG: tyrosine-type recombinase/integrase [Desulfobacter sp.]|nr:MAG: tyrosine-type recombinase/integrase [Desulfobacter sp.]